MFRAYKYRLMPTADQAELINKHIGSCRLVYNLALELKKIAYVQHGKQLSCFDLANQLPELKKECEWLKEVDSQSLQQSIINLDKAFKQFFKGHADFPKFKKKAMERSFRNPHGKKIQIENGKIYQSKFREGIPIVIDREIDGEIRSTTISRTPTGKYFVSVFVKTGKEVPILNPVKKATSLGIDLGLKDFITTSNGDKTQHPKYLQKSRTRLKFLQSQYSRKRKGSNSQRRWHYKLALCHERVVNQRKDFLHKLSTELVKNHDTLCFETLRIENMKKNHNLAQSISASGWSVFVEMCKYKAEWNGKNVLQIPTFQASTKLCSNCGATNNTLTLNDREWDCANCLTHHDRDINAAINIKNIALKENCGGVRRGKRGELPTLVGAENLEASIKIDVVTIERRFLP